MKQKTLMVSGIAASLLGLIGPPVVVAAPWGSFASPGQRICNTGADVAGPIPRTVAGGVFMGPGMMGSVACVNCHGEDGHGAGTDVAIATADVVLVGSNPNDIPTVVALARATYGKMVQNLVWATGHNVIAIPLAAGVLAGAGVLLSPASAEFSCPRRRSSSRSMRGRFGSGRDARNSGTTMPSSFAW